MNVADLDKAVRLRNERSQAARLRNRLRLGGVRAEVLCFHPHLERLDAEVREGAPMIEFLARACEHEIERCTEALQALGVSVEPAGD